MVWKSLKIDKALFTYHVIMITKLIDKDVIVAKKKKPGILMIILAIIFPFIAVGLHKGIGKDLIINILLCIIFYVPGIIHALWILLK
jgi:uncharacterized membrane protein YqaE (UPF0057 family)